VNFNVPSVPDFAEDDTVMINEDFTERFAAFQERLEEMRGYL